MAADSSAFAPRRLLVPLDGSRLAEAVLPVVERLAAAFGAPAPAFEPEVILVGLDGTAAAESALGPATILATKLGARLHLAMVVATRDTLRDQHAAAAVMLPSATNAILELEQRQAELYLS